MKRVSEYQTLRKLIHCATNPLCKAGSYLSRHFSSQHLAVENWRRSTAFGDCSLQRDECHAWSAEVKLLSPGIQSDELSCLWEYVRHYVYALTLEGS